MSQYNSASRLQYRSLDDKLLPKKEQWALIYQKNALDEQRLKQLQKLHAKNKKQIFRQQLDQQVHGKNDHNRIQKQQDRRYYEFITKRAEQMKQKQEREKLQKMERRRQVQLDNQHLLQLNHQISRSQTQGNQYSFDIGYKAEMQRRKKQQEEKKKIHDALDKQLTLKAQEHKKQRQKQQELQRINRSYQEEQFSKRNRGGRQYGQNFNVYQHYQNLQFERLKRQKQLQHRIIDQAAMRREQQEYKRMREASQKKHYLQNTLRQTLDQQVQMHNYKKKQESRTNPEENSYSYIGSMFRPKVSPYDKKQYSQYLKMQAQQQKMKKNIQNHMSQQEYRLNINQLNRAVNGDYADNTYLDRSLTAVGEKDQKLYGNVNDTVADPDAQIIKHKLDNIRHKQSRTMNKSLIL